MMESSSGRPCHSSWSPPEMSDPIKLTRFTLRFKLCENGEKLIFRDSIQRDFNENFEPKFIVTPKISHAVTKRIKTRKHFFYYSFSRRNRTMLLIFFLYFSLFVITIGKKKQSREFSQVETSEIWIFSFQGTFLQDREKWEKVTLPNIVEFPCRIGDVRMCVRRYMKASTHTQLGTHVSIHGIRFSHSIQ